ncbi:hypothetical protein F511_26978 [Dorcoceras hygrometricum]|uniref:Uncharacterized protein n=1 Tax=Dorcoceras hygrometricum TaxID=472368 RepID=A0A2Z7AI98_9LAMI|nr:hypothetical protein F511_26978 [Dorcoceras hygrometricum]
MHRVVNYHSSWARQQQVEFIDASGIRVWCQGNPGFTAGRGFHPAGGAPGGGKWVYLGTHAMSLLDLRDALSVIPRGSWGDVARRFTMIRWISPIRSMTRNKTPSSACTRRTDEISMNRFSSSNWPETNFRRRRAAAAAAHGGGGV